jgi:hypothetical protein
MRPVDMVVAVRWMEAQPDEGAGLWASPPACQGTGVFLARSPTSDTAVSDPTRAGRTVAGRPAPADKRAFFERLVEFISPGPDSKDELIETLADAEQRELIEPESRLMLEGVLRMADMTAGDVMVAAPRMDLLDIDADPLRRAAGQRDRHRALALSGLRGPARQRHRHPDGQGPAQAAARARTEPAHPAAAGGLRAREQAA